MPEKDGRELITQRSLQSFAISHQIEFYGRFAKNIPLRRRFPRRN